ncbi:hypothetical protein [Pseudoalteromonas denitrificans]|uniref:Uncharacterized protein n=1 Tax=Pseudoalteromonas denitrificans DSM 6059 TaxID=1123010 RepID=A0A1I1N6W1_9GAMM|nr:hypothetical protein [Pseudoalteromonas denitrificans]SFC92942.1 hypothetical protein SAMN02745724_02958 [Pseudoalteromonas denitrificans DSM 6059]
MKLRLKLNKKKLKNLSKDQKALPLEATLRVTGGAGMGDDSLSGSVCHMFSMFVHCSQRCVETFKN